MQNTKFQGLLQMASALAYRKNWFQREGNFSTRFDSTSEIVYSNKSDSTAGPMILLVFRVIYGVKLPAINFSND